MNEKFVISVCNGHAPLNSKSQASVTKYIQHVLLQVLRRLSVAFELVLNSSE